MSFATNSSAFGMKPPNPSTSIFGTQSGTQPANQGTSLFGGGFGQSQQQPASTGLFGQSSSSTTQPASTGLFGQQPAVTGGGIFGQNANSTQPSTTNIFGQPGTSTAQQPSTSLFGQSTGNTTHQPVGSLFSQPNTQSTQQPPTGLFGQPTSGMQQPTVSGLFGQSTTNAQQQPGTTGLFGQSISNTQQQPQQGTFGQSLFGNTTHQNQNQNQSGQPNTTFGGLGSFGSNSNQQQLAGQGSTFGGFGRSSTNSLQAQPTQPSLFGSTLSSSTTPGGTLFGQQQQQSTSAVPTGQPLFSKSTKFNDLPDELKKLFENIDSHIQGRVQISNELKQRKLGDEAMKGQELIRAVHKDFVNLTSVIKSDANFTKDMLVKVDQAVQDAIVATRIIDGFRNPHQSGAFLKNHMSFPLEFFIRVTQQMRERLQWYKATIEQIERKLSVSTNQLQHTPQSIASTLQAQNATFVILASRTATVDAELQKVKALYTQLWRTKTGSMRDPFHDLDRNAGDDFGLESLRVS